MPQPDPKPTQTGSEGPGVPLVLQEPLSIIALGDTGTEPMALRGVLEAFNYRVEIHWVGSRKQFIAILRGDIPTHPYVVLSAHGDERGILVPDEAPVGADELAEVVHLPDRVLLSLACRTGGDAFAKAFLAGGCHAYIAASEEMEASSALLFAIHLFYFLSPTHRRPLREAVGEARKHDAQCARFSLYSP
jgi:hypothetical protein